MMRKITWKGESDTAINFDAFIHLAVAPRYLLLEIIFIIRCGSKNHELFVPKRHYRVDEHGASRRNVGCQERNEHEQDSNAGKSHRILC